MTGKNDTDNCDLCYIRTAMWGVEMRHRVLPHIAAFACCDACQKLLVDVVAPILHKMGHADLIEALLAKAKELNITYEQIMDPNAWRGLKELQ